MRMNPWLCLVTSNLADGMFQRGTGLAAEKRQAPAEEKQSAGGTPPSRGREGAHPARISLCRTWKPRKGPGRVSGRPPVRNAQLPGGHRMTQEANAGGRKAAGNRDGEAGPSSRSSRITGRTGPKWPDPKGC